MDTLRVDPYDQAKPYSKHPHAHKNGGYHMNLVEDSNVMSIVGSVVKQIGQKMARGDFNLATLVKPVQLTHPMTMLEALSNDMTFASTYFSLAAQCKDPLERIQYIVLSAVSAVHVNQSILHSKAPIDCVVGETLQLEKPDGSQFFAEFIKSNPPTSLIQLYGPNNEYKLWACDEVFAEIHPTFTEIIGRTPRKRYLQFKDGKRFELSLPVMIVEGVLNGDRILNFMDSFTIKGLDDNLTARITFSYQYHGKVTKLAKKLTGFVWSNAQKVPNDLVNIEIFKTVMIDDEEKQFTLSTGSGVWLSYLQFDGRVMWRWNDGVQPWASQQNLLPSDSTLRLDRTLILQNKLDLAQKARLQIEEDDNQCQKLRNKAKK